MSKRKSERLMNLVIALLSARRFLAKEQLRTLIADYRELSDEAFERQFERDKDILRNLGVPIEMGSNSAFFSDELGYRIRQAAFQLPDIEFTPEEVAALAAASQVWQQTSMAESTARALAKLGSAVTDSFSVFAPSVDAHDAAFLPLWRAFYARQVAVFSYRDGSPRKVEPWALVSRHGAWYLIGRDQNKDERRTFKLSRITSAVRLSGSPEAFRVPTELDVAACLKELDIMQPDAVAVVAVRDGRATDLTRRGESIEWATPLPPGFTAWRIPYRSQIGLVADVATAGCDALPLDPPELTAGVRDHLTALLERLHVKAVADDDAKRQDMPDPELLQPKQEERKQTTTSYDQVQRLLSLVPYLQANPGVAIDKVARVFQVTSEQIVKDLQVAWLIGLPGGLPDDLIDVNMELLESDGVIYLSNAQFLPRPLRFTSDEALALIVALQAIREVATGVAAKVVTETLAKLSSAVDANQLGQVLLDVASGDDDVRTKLAAAIAENTRVQFNYFGGSSGTCSTPIVDPLRIEVLDGVAYLVGFAVEREDWRTYRLERVTDVNQLTVPALTHPNPPARKASWFAALGECHSVTLELTTEAEWMTEYFPVSNKCPSPGGFRVDLPVADSRWLTRLILSLGCNIIAIDPPEAAAAAVIEATHALAGLDG
ncbi:MAG: WYL domain-containing protein [Propionibacteriaceae bacterium]|nr:WYL domain-containing protein [Propionibacteriaceae bacterium]